MAIFSFRKATPHFFFVGFLILTPLFATTVLAQSAGPATERLASTENIRIPVGTILPARLNHGLSSKSARPGQSVTARIMQ
ncbi:MAG TPA: hypothetical protein VNO13_00795, partial [Candidatus Udaeobacter sp.]|nr:hypothetical protein [Candidatus Udaeobacter sp.]